MINDNLRQQRHDKSIPSNLLVLFDRPLASFTRNIIYIDCPNNCETRLEVVCTIFCFLKITSFHTPHNNFKRLCRFRLSNRGKNDLIVVFRLNFLRLFFRDSFAENRRRHIPAVSRIKLKFTEHAQQNAPLLVTTCWLH